MRVGTTTFDRTLNLQVAPSNEIIEKLDLIYETTNAHGTKIISQNEVNIP